MSRIDELAELIESLSGADAAYATAIPGLHLTRLSSTGAPRHTLDQALYCVTAQGAKCVYLNDERYVYEPGKYLLISLDLPIVGEILDASPSAPLLSLSLALDFNEISALMLDAQLPPITPAAKHASMIVSDIDDALLDATIRLVRLLRTPAQVPILAPLIKREIYYRLLLGDQSALLRRMASDNGQVRRIAVGIEWVRRNALRPIRMEDLAREVNMSPSTMHAWFKSVTSMSPLQFQKQLRLQEARRLLLSENSDAATVSHRVGYDSPSQFSREYARLFGAPPRRDIERIRSRAEGLHGAMQYAE